MFHNEDFNLECFRLNERKRFLELLEKHRVTMYLCGHTHMNQLWSYRGKDGNGKVDSYSVAGTTMRIPDVEEETSVNGIRVIDVYEDGRIEMKFHELKFEGDLAPPFFPASTVDVLRERAKERL